MLNHTKKIGLLICVASLSACGTFNPNGYTNPNSYSYHATPIFPESYEGETKYTDEPQRSIHHVVVPQSYHMTNGRTPVSFKDADKQWVSSQDPNAYTIELSNGDNASDIANKLYKAPKEQHAAQVGYENNGKTYYKGLYGTYPTLDAAQEALKKLPDDIKQGADVKPWSTIQNTVGK